MFGAIASLLRPPPPKKQAGSNPNEPSYEFIQSSDSDDAKERRRTENVMWGDWYAVRQDCLRMRFKITLKGIKLYVKKSARKEII